MQYYGNSPEEQDNLNELLRAHKDTLHELLLQAARYGGVVPSQIALGIKQAEANIRAIEEQQNSPIDDETVDGLGDKGRFKVVTRRLDLIGDQIRLMQRQSDESREQALKTQVTEQRKSRSEREKIRKQVADIAKQVQVIKADNAAFQESEQQAREEGQKKALDVQQEALKVNRYLFYGVMFVGAAILALAIVLAFR